MAIRITNKKPLRRRVQQRQAGVIIISVAIVLSAFIIRSNSDSAEASGPVNAVVVGQFDTILVPVPDQLIPTGTKLKNAKFHTVAFPRAQVPPDAILTLDSYLEAESKATLPANLPLFPSNLALNGSLQNAVAERIPVGMRAMTVSVDETSAVEGWVEAGSVVDVLLQEHERTTVIAERVKILSAARNVNPRDGAPTKAPTTVTLLVSQEQCLAINTALPLGKIGFVLRGSSDDELWVDKSFSAAKLKNGTNGTIDTTPRRINGYISVKDKDGSAENYALSNGKWVKSELGLRGFLVDKEVE